MQNKTEPRFTPMAEAIHEFERQLESQTKDDFFPTGFASHDLALGRLRRGTLTLVGARSSMGKTAFMLSSALAQLEVGIHVHYFTLEMSISDIIARLVSIKTGIPLFDILQRRISEEQARGIVGALPALSDLRGDWSEESNLKRLVGLLKQIERGSRSIVYVDFLGEVEVPGLSSAENYAVTTEVGHGLKRAAMELQVPIVTAVQFNRQIELRKEKRPVLADFRDSGRLEEISDLALGLYRPAYYDEKLPDNELQVFCLKHRNGPKNNYFLAWDPKCARAYEKTGLSLTEVA